MINSERIPDHAPTVAMDIRLGKKHDYVDFDYDAFQELSERQGYPYEQLTDLTVSVSNSFDGYHDKSGVLSVPAGRRANKVLSHELQHATDYANGENMESSVSYRTGVRSGYAMRVATPLEIAELVASSFSSNQLIERAMLPTAAITGALAVSYALGYHFTSRERRARSAERQALNVLSFK